MSKLNAEQIIADALACKGSPPKDDALRDLRAVIEAVRFRAVEGIDQAEAAKHHAAGERAARHALNDILCVLDAVEVKR